MKGSGRLIEAILWVLLREGTRRSAADTPGNGLAVTGESLHLLVLYARAGNTASAVHLKTEFGETLALSCLAMREPES